MGLSKSLFQLVAKNLSAKKLYLSKSLVYSKTYKQVLEHNLDFVRYTTLELCCNELNVNKVNGNAAELGVYKGNFAQRINYLMPDRKLYLFDTFEGFHEEDIKKEVSKNFSSGEQDFSDTSVELVLNKMKNRSNCIVKKGYFPGTATDIDDKFCFVSIDADLYEPILNGLKFFYPRLENKGYIFVHDFNNYDYKGARQAVLEFCNENNIGYTPIPDTGGSIIITK